MNMPILKIKSVNPKIFNKDRKNMNHSMSNQQGIRPLPTKIFF